MSRSIYFRSPLLFFKALRRNTLRDFSHEKAKEFSRKTFRTFCRRMGISNASQGNPRKQKIVFVFFPIPKNDNLMVSVTIKFNYAIKLYLIAKCVACRTGFCDAIDSMKLMNFYRFLRGPERGQFMKIILTTGSPHPGQ